MTEYSILKEINDFYSSVANQSLIRKVERTTFFDIINKSRREDVHSNFLKWVFMLDKLPCPDALMPVNNLLRIIIRRAIEQNKENELPDIILEDILCGSATVRVTDVKREERCPGVAYRGGGKDNEGIIDIVIECEIVRHSENANTTTPLKIFIENKVDSKEHDMQTWKYYVYYKQGKCDYPKEIEVKDSRKLYEPQSDDEKHIFVYLTPDKDDEINEASNGRLCHHYIHINYQDIVDDILCKLLLFRELDARTRVFIEEYIDTLSIPNLNYNNGSIMALNKKDEELLVKFWNANERLITLALEALASHTKDEEAKGAAEEALSSLKTLKSRQVYQITTPWNPLAKDVCGHTKMVTFVVKDYAETHSQRDVENAFNGKGIRNNLEVIYNEGNLPNDKSRYSQEKIKCSDKKSIWCTNQWIPVVAERFITEAESLGYTIKKL